MPRFPGSEQVPERRRRRRGGTSQNTHFQAIVRKIAEGDLKCTSLAGEDGETGLLHTLLPTTPAVTTNAGEEETPKVL
jgi:hypothetical protein